MTTQANEPGTIRRANILLRLLATAGKRGLALTEIATRSGLPHGTVHRLLRQMADEGMVFQHEDSRRYLLGPVAWEIGLAAAEIFDFRYLCRPVLEKLTRETEDTAYFVLRSGFDAVCIDRVEGAFPIRTITLEVGSRRPLGVGAGGMAILAACADDERERIIQATAARLPDFHNLDVARHRQDVETARHNGYALVRNRVTLGVTALGVPFHDGLRRPIGAISVGAIDQRLREPRRETVLRLLREQALQIEKAVRGARPTFIDR